MSDNLENPDKQKNKLAAKPTSRSDALPPRQPRAVDAMFDLEKRYPEAGDLFAPHLVSSTDKQDVIVSIDTNALLLPYSVGKSDLNEIANVYRRLSNEQRLFLPARAAREFIKHRDRKLADLINALDKRFQVAAPTMLDSLSGYTDLMAAVKKMQTAQKEYDTAKALVVAGIKNWRGNDPVSKLYREVFSKGKIIEHDGKVEEVAEEWSFREGSEIPPGYRDSGKEDSGIGDFLIWKSILKIGADQKRDMVFVTAERKSDWFVRASGEPVYPRPELIDEYRRFSGGHNIRLATLADLLGELHAPKKVVEEVREAEDKANVSVETSTERSPRIFNYTSPRRSLFNYSAQVPREVSYTEPFFNYSAQARGLGHYIDPNLYHSRFVGGVDPYAASYTGRSILAFPNIHASDSASTRELMNMVWPQPIRQIASPARTATLYFEYPHPMSAMQASTVLQSAQERDRDAHWVREEAFGQLGFV